MVADRNLEKHGLPNIYEESKTLNLGYHVIPILIVLLYINRTNKTSDLYLRFNFPSLNQSGLGNTWAHFIGSINNTNDHAS